MLDIFNAAVRLLVVVAGVVLIFVGARYAFMLFDTIYQGLGNPEGGAQLLEQWAQFLVRDMPGVEHSDGLRRAENVRVLAALIVGLGAVVLAWIALRIVVAGGQIVSLVTADERTTRKILHEVARQGRGAGQ